MWNREVKQRAMIFNFALCVWLSSMATASSEPPAAELIRAARAGGTEETDGRAQDIEEPQTRLFFILTSTTVISSGTRQDNTNREVEAEESASAKNSAQGKARILCFPEDRSMGMLQARDAGVHDDLFTGFTEFCEARGNVTVAPGKELILDPSREAARDLSPLTKLKTDDLYAIYCWQIPIDDEGLRYVAHLSGLKVLWLAYAPISDKGLSHLRGLKSLKSLLVMGTKVGDEGMAYLGDLDSLEYLNPRATNVTDHGLAHLSGLGSLKSIDLGYCKITDAGLEHLGRIETLESIDVSHSTITDAGIAHLKNLRSLRDLDLQSTNITDAGLKHLGTLSSFRKVNLRRTKITDSGLAHLANSRGLEELRVNSTRITDSGLAHLRSMDSLKYLDIGWTRVTEEGLQHLSELTSLETLVLPRDNGITEEGLAHLAGLRQLKHLTGIPGDLSDRGLRCLSKMQLESLDLRGAEITDETMPYVAQLTNLRELELQKCSTTNAGLAELTKLKSLRSIHLTNNPQITGAGLVHIGKLSWLESVYLREIYEVGDDDIAHLANLTGLTQFVTDSDRITDAGVAHLSNMHSLEGLALENASLTDKALSHVANAKKLEHVRLGGNFTDAGLRHLEGLSLLKSLTLPGKGLSTEALEELERKLPLLANLNAKGASSRRAMLTGKRLTEFEGIDIDYNIEQAKGSKIVLCFFDMEQRPSRNLVERLAKREKELAEHSFVVLLVHTSGVDGDKLRQWLADCKIPFACGTISKDAERVLYNWGVKAQPWLVLIDEQGHVTAGGFGLESLTPEGLNDLTEQAKAGPHIFKLKHGGPEKVIESLKKILEFRTENMIAPAFEAASVEVVPDADALLIPGNAESSQLVMDLLAVLDVPTHSQGPQADKKAFAMLQQVEYVDNKQLAELLRSLFTDGVDAEAIAAKQLIVRSSKSDSERIEKLIRLLDEPR